MPTGPPPPRPAPVTAVTARARATTPGTPTRPPPPRPWGRGSPAHGPNRCGQTYCSRSHFGEPHENRASRRMSSPQSWNRYTNNTRESSPLSRSRPFASKSRNTDNLFPYRRRPTPLCAPVSPGRAAPRARGRMVSPGAAARGAAGGPAPVPVAPGVARAPRGSSGPWGPARPRARSAARGKRASRGSGPRLRGPGARVSGPPARPRPREAGSRRGPRCVRLSPARREGAENSPCCARRVTADKYRVSKVTGRGAPPRRRNRRRASGVVGPAGGLDRGATLGRVGRVRGRVLELRLWSPGTYRPRGACGNGDPPFDSASRRPVSSCEPK